MDYSFLDFFPTSYRKRYKETTTQFQVIAKKCSQLFSSLDQVCGYKVSLDVGSTRAHSFGMFFVDARLSSLGDVERDVRFIVLCVPGV